MTDYDALWNAANELVAETKKQMRRVDKTIDHQRFADLDDRRVRLKQFRHYVALKEKFDHA